MPTPNSILIIGAGIAGLTIAERIMRHQQSLAVTIVGATDERSQRVSFWRDRNRSAALALPGAQSWSAWSFNTPNLGFSLQGGKALEYVSFDARSYKAHLTDSLQQAGVRHFDDLVKSVQKTSQGFHIETSQRAIEADVVIDTRPPELPESTLKQQFVGRTLTTQSPHAIAHPVLMDFNIAPIAPNGISFIYALPLSDTRLLVEATTFSYETLAQEPYESAIDAWIQAHVPAVELNPRDEVEHGILPMGPVTPRQTELLAAGLAGNAARHATGYAFTGILRQAEHFAEALRTGQGLTTIQPYSGRSRWMDSLFLDLMRDNPAHLIQLFEAMAHSLSGDDFAHFLSDTGGWMPCLRTIAAAPKRPLLAALWKRL